MSLPLPQPVLSKRGNCLSQLLSRRHVVRDTTPGTILMLKLLFPPCVVVPWRVQRALEPPPRARQPARQEEASSQTSLGAGE
jgi:hypothetical protein